MRIAALVNAPNHVCARYRLSAFRPFLEEAGHSLTLVPWPSFPSRLVFDTRIREAGVVVIQRRLLSAWQLFCLKRVAARIWFDFDDAVFLRDSYHPKGPHSRRLQRGFARMAAASQCVLAGNSFLAAHAARWTRPDRVQVLPTCVDVNRYHTARHGEKANVTLTWIGSSSTLQGLDQIRAPLEDLGRRNPNTAFQVICDRSLTWQDIPIHFRPWSEEREADDLAAADIGISWIPNDDWSRGKCGLKVLQYMAAGLPVVANAVGVHPDMIENGKTGLLADTPQQFASAIETLIKDAGLRERMGQAGRERVERHYSLMRGARQWLGLLERADGSSATSKCVG